MEYVIVFSDTNTAIMAERCLLDASVAVSVMPLPESIDAGCGITLRVRGDLLKGALKVLEDNGAHASGVYSRVRTGAGYVYEKLQRI